MAQVGNAIDVGTASADQTTESNPAHASAPVDSAVSVTEEPKSTTDSIGPVQPIVETTAAVDPSTTAANTESSAESVVAEDPVVGLWSKVSEDAGDFTSWTTLVETVLQGNDIGKIQQACDAFLNQYPHCYVFWKKYADAILTHTQNPADGYAVYERAVQATPLSVEVWIAYIHLRITHKNTGEKTPEELAALNAEILALCERAVQAAGLEYKSAHLWSTYIAFVKDITTNVAEVVQVYHKAFAIPLESHTELYQAFEALAREQETPSVLATPEQLAAATAAAGAVSPTELKEAVREYIISSAYAVIEASAVEAAKRKPFEDLITRPYFHTQALDDASLSNWRAYLKFEQEQAASAGTAATTTADGSRHQRVLVLFERCLIACALYDEFWIRYAKFYLDVCGDVAQARNVLQRGARLQVYPPPRFHQLYAGFEESQGDVAEARRILRAAAVDATPVAVESVVAYAAFERRHGDVEAGLSAFTSAAAKCADNAKARPLLAATHAQFLRSIGRAPDARAALENAIAIDGGAVVLYKQLLDFEISQHLDAASKESEDRVLAVFDKVAASEQFDVVAKAEMAELKVRFVIEHSTTTTADQWGLLHGYLYDGVTEDGSNSLDRKRKAEAGGEESDAKRQHFQQSQQQGYYQQPVQQPYYQQPMQAQPQMVWNGAAWVAPQQQWGQQTW
eukprot:m.513116 g.513116  ORF g.513116 m.513116 type:complete len:683 (-) comp21901_c0_seq2:307-2355(-)